jgi:type II secretory pathway pseudopilin PulG
MTSGIGWLRALRRRLSAPGSEDGFSIIEALAALAVIAVVLSALTANLISSYAASRTTKEFQQATALANRAMESARDLPYDQLVMKSSDVASLPTTTNCPSRYTTAPPPGTRFYDPDGSGPLCREPVVSSDAGGIALTPNVTSVTERGDDCSGARLCFRVARFVTWVDDTTTNDAGLTNQGGPGRSFKRLTVVVTWDSIERTRTYRTDTFITRARRGLPTPKFDLSPRTALAGVEPGTPAVFPHTITNFGITDTIDLTIQLPAGKTWVVTWHKDLGERGVFEPGVDTLLTDTNANGIRDTGPIITGGRFDFLIVIQIPATEALGQTLDIIVTARSGAVPTRTRTARDTISIQAQTLRLYLHNLFPLGASGNPVPGNTTAQKDQPMDPSAPTSVRSLPFIYSTDLWNQDNGRWIDNRKNPVPSESAVRDMANWVYQLPAHTTFNGVGRLTVWVAQPRYQCNRTLDFTMYVRVRRSLASDAGTDIVTQAFSVPTSACTNGIRQHQISFSMNNVTVRANRYLELKLLTTNPGQNKEALVLYDSTTSSSDPLGTHNSRLTLPRVSQ